MWGKQAPFEGSDEEDIEAGDKENVLEVVEENNVANREREYLIGYF